MSSTTAYRRDIDGLRAFAVLPVLAFHAKLPGFSGGFVGVDVFFVISGFLITAIIAREIDEGQFSLLKFYERRARRILPALLVMIAAVLVFATWLYLPADFAAVPRSALMTLGFLANVWFFTQTSYFGGPADAMPLLHCWSLAVEEQFYVAFPAVLWLCARAAPRQRLTAVALLVLASFALAVWKQADTDGFAFYLLPARTWELLAGSMLALFTTPKPSSRPLPQTLALLGLMLIVWPVAAYDRTAVFPGVAALAPVLGTVLLIRFAQGTMVGSLLSLPLLVGIGLISYSLYLWHWPLIVFAEYVANAPLVGARQAVVVVASFIFAWASWRFVERPFRNAQRFNRRRIFTLSVASMGAIAATCIAVLSLGGWSTRFPAQVTQMAEAVTDISPKRGTCIIESAGGDHPDCVLGANVPPSAAIWGDSHGVELAFALGEKLQRSGASIVQRTRASCAPVIGYAVPSDPGCATNNVNTLETLVVTPNIKRVYLVAFWASPAYNQPGMIRMIDGT
ncbi:MAG: acyltransferase, partial [Novosphingobium sp. 35-62-5]